MLPQRFHENAGWGKWTSPFARNMLEIPARELEQFASEPELTALLLQCVRDVPATLLQCFRNASTKFAYVAEYWGKWWTIRAQNARNPSG